MSVWKKKGIVILLTCLLVLLLGTGALAGTVPGGPSTAGPTPTAGIMTYADIVKALYSIETSAKGAVDVFTLSELAVYGKTKSEAGRELYVARVGTGPMRVWVSANIHGNEQLTSEAVIQILKYLAVSGKKDAKAIRDAMTIYMIPTMNPDGREANTRGTWLYDDGTGLPTGVTVDLNRDWHSLMRADETKAWYAFWCWMEPNYLLDLHHMGIHNVPYTDEVASLSLGISLSPDRNTIPAAYKDPVRQLQAYVYDSIIKYGYTHIDRYQLYGYPAPGLTGELDFQGGMSSAVMVGTSFFDYDGLNVDNWSCPAIFFETKGNTSDGSLGQKANGYLVKQNYQGIMAYLYGLATGEVWDVPANHWYDVPAISPIWGYYTDGGPVPAAADAAGDWAPFDFDFM